MTDVSEHGLVKLVAGVLNLYESAFDAPLHLQEARAEDVLRFRPSLAAAACRLLSFFRFCSSVVVDVDVVGIRGQLLLLQAIQGQLLAEDRPVHRSK